jgi:hypothetical protein
MSARAIRFALLADGQSDRALLHTIRWVLIDSASDVAEPRFRARNPGAQIRDEMQQAVDLFAPDILFVHRDAEGADPSSRLAEIPDLDIGRLVRIVPVRMTEAWLLFDQQAIRTAAGNPHSRTRLTLPSLQEVENVPDPKTTLHQALIAAADLSGRRAKRLSRDMGTAVQRVAELISSFAPLRQLSAFTLFEDECRAALKEIGRIPASQR